MSELIQNPITLALLSALSASLMTIFAKLGLKDIDPMILLLVRTFLSVIILAIFLTSAGKLVNLNNIHWDTKSILFVILSTIASLGSLIFYFYALQKGEATLVSGVDKLSIVFTLVFAILILGEKLTVLKLAGIVLTIIGTILLIL